MENRVSFLTLNVFYLIGAIIFLTAGNMIQAWNFEMGLIITEYVFVLGLSFLILKYSHAPVKDYFHLKDVSMKTIVKTFFIVFFSLPIVMLLNLISLYVLDLLGLALNYEMPMATEFPNLIYQFLIISISAGICEEIFFRGVIMTTLTDYFTPWKAIVLSAIMFGVFHFNIGNIFGPIYLGLVFGYLTIKTGSIIPAILGHMTNNGVAYVISYMGTFVAVEESEAVLESIDLLDTILSLSIVALFCLGIVLYLLKSISGIDLQSSHGDLIQPKKAHYIPLYAVGIIYIGFTAWILL